MKYRCQLGTHLMYSGLTASPHQSSDIHSRTFSMHDVHDYSCIVSHCSVQKTRHRLVLSFGPLETSDWLHLHIVCLLCIDCFLACESGEEHAAWQPVI